jgi:hypothetical protein
MTEYVLKTAANFGDDFADEMVWFVVTTRACQNGDYRTGYGLELCHD